MHERRLLDIVKWDSSGDNITAQLRAIADAIETSGPWIHNRLPGDERNLILFNLLFAPLPYINLVAQNPFAPLPVLGFCAGGVFELDVRARHVLRSEANLRRWMAETADDGIDIVKALMGLAEPNDPRLLVLEGELQRIEELKIKHRLPKLKKAEIRIASLAGEVGLGPEYKSLFKIFSKLVHPTSYVVNGGRLLQEDDLRNVLLICLQLYALDPLTRITDEMGVPVDLKIRTK